MSETPKIVGWKLLSEDERLEEEKYRCKSTRGPRSKLQCEVYEGHNDAHAARGVNGQWYFW